MAGFPQDKNIINNRAGSIAINVRNVFREVDDFATFLDGKQDADLTALGFDAGDITVLRGAFAALAKLSRIARAQDTQSEVDDFLFNARKLYGAS